MQKSFKRPDGRYQRNIFIGRDVFGKRKYKTVYGTTQKEADEKALNVKLSLHKGLDVMASRDTFGDWAARWLDIKSAQVGAGMLAEYKCCLQHLYPLSDISLSKLRPADLQQILTDLSQYNLNTGKPASAGLLRSIRITMSQICRMAIDNRVIDYNLADNIIMPHSPAPERRRALTPEEQAMIRDTPHRAQTAAMIMMYAGLRRGELIPLTWMDIDLHAHTISVNKSVTLQKNRPVIKQGGKTRSANRIIDIPQLLVDFLSGLDKQALLVCPSTHGLMLTDTAWKRMWSSYMQTLNTKYGDFAGCLRGGKTLPMVIQPFTAHCLRHTFATLLYCAGVDVLTARDQLGHANINTTLSIYTHLDKQYKRQSMEKLNTYIKQNTG